MFFYLTISVIPNHFTLEHYQLIDAPQPAIVHPYISNPQIPYPCHSITLLFSGAHEAKAAFTPIHI